MSLIKKAAELNLQTKMKVLIYGQAGTGKSTLAISAPKPLLFDFDGGVHRINFSHLSGVDTVQITSYQNFLDVLEEDLSSYESFIIDTGGKMLDYMAEHIVKKNPKMGKSNGTLTLQGYGERKAEFTALNRRFAIMNKHIIYVAHRETQTDGDDKRYVPLFGGSNYDSLVTELDLVGYLEANGRKRVITFDPTSRNDGKNTCNLPATIEIPVIVDAEGNPTAPNSFLIDQIIKPYQARLEQRKKDAEKFNQLMATIREQIELITDEQSANEFVRRIDEFEHIGTSKVMAAKILAEHTKGLKLAYNKETKSYEKV